MATIMGKKTMASNDLRTGTVSAHLIYMNDGVRLCAEACACSCITEGDGKYIIDAEACISCGSCAGACPVDAPVED